MAGLHSIDKLPPKDRQRVINTLIDAHHSGQTPDYRGLIKALKLKCSHISLWRYDKKHVKPTMKRNLDLILSSKSSDPNGDAESEAQDKSSAIEKAQSETVQRLVDDPIVRAIIAKRERMEAAISDTFNSKAYETFAKLESVDLRALEMHAKAIQHPGFVASAPQQAAGATVVVVMPTATDPRMDAWRARQGSIEVKAEDSEE